MHKALDIARYFLGQIDDDSGDTISNLKLQKLLYYAQGYHLALFGKRLFSDKIEAWSHGPVVPVVYHAYKRYGGGAIDPPRRVPFEIFSREERELLDEVWSVIGQFSAWKLRNMTHEEPPWRDTEQGSEIKPTLMRKHFSELVGAASVSTPLTAGVFLG